MGYPVWSGGAGPLSGLENVPTLRESCDARLLFGSICWRNVWMQHDATTKIDETSESVVDWCTTAIVALKSAVSSCALPVLRRLNVFSLFSA